MANLTLSIDDDLLKQSRLYAVQHDTSVNALVREYLESLVSKAKDAEQAERRKTVETLQSLAEQVERENLVTSDWKWNREELYEERMARWNQR